MHLRIRSIVVATLAIALLISVAQAKTKERLKQSFDGIDRIKIETVSGDCVVEKGESDAVSLTVLSVYSPPESFDPEVNQRGSTLYLEENIHGSNSGYSTWILTVPDGITVQFETASGDLSVSGVKGEFSASTASGDIEFEGSSGQFEFSTASGDIRMDECDGIFEISTASGDIRTADCDGEFELSTASGDVIARTVKISDDSKFATASGNVSVRLGAPLVHDIRIGTASGSARLDLNGNPANGRFEFTVRAHRGEIDCPFDFDKEERFEEHGDEYVMKSFTTGSSEPLVTIRTASGDLSLRK